MAVPDNNICKRAIFADARPGPAGDGPLRTTGNGIAAVAAGRQRRQVESGGGASIGAWVYICTPNIFVKKF
jgi:hypothetical protein